MRDLNVKEVRRLNVKAGETVVFKFAHFPTASQRDRITEVARDALPEGVKLLVTGPEPDVSVIASEEEAA